MKILSQREQWPRRVAAATWYHASEHKLPVGTRLIPHGGSSIYDDWYKEEGLDDNPNYVWIEPDLRRITDAWAGPHSHIYEVEPEESPYNQGGGGWTTSAAKITKYLGIGKDLGVEMTGPE